MSLRERQKRESRALTVIGAILDGDCSRAKNFEELKSKRSRIEA